MPAGTSLSVLWGERQPILGALFGEKGERKFIVRSGFLCPMFFN
jgi:hypothetical protein